MLFHVTPINRRLRRRLCEANDAAAVRQTALAVVITRQGAVRLPPPAIFSPVFHAAARPIYLCTGLLLSGRARSKALPASPPVIEWTGNVLPRRRCCRRRLEKRLHLVTSRKPAAAAAAAADAISYPLAGLDSSSPLSVNWRTCGASGVPWCRTIWHVNFSVTCE